MTEPVLSIVIGTRNRRDAYWRFVTSVIATASVPTELLVGDASTDPYAQNMIPSETGNVVRFTVVPQNPPVGHVKGYNRMFRLATGKYVSWFNDDCEMLPGWDRIAIDYMEAHPDLGIGCVYFKDNIATGHDCDYVVQTLYKTTYANFGVLLRTFGDQLGWFDEDLHMYGADTALTYAALAAGKAVAPIPKCKTLHYREQDAVRAENYANTRAHSDRATFDRKWKYKVPDLREEMNRRFGHLRQPEAIQ